MTLPENTSVFTTALVQNGYIIWFDEHLARLKRHANALNIAYPGDSLIREKVQAIDARKAQLLRITLGPNGIMLEARPINPPSPMDYAGARIITTDVRVDSLWAKIKTSDRLPYQQAQELAVQQGAFEGLLIDNEGYVVDGSRSSPLLFRDQTLISLEGGIHGITREKVLAKAQSLGLHIARAKLKSNGLNGLMLIAGCGIGLVPAGQVQDERIAQLISSYRITCPESI